MNKVDISVIVPIHNTPQEPLRQCLESLISQKEVSYEIILVDDYSTKHETIEIINKYKSKYEKLITYIRMQKNCGAAEARNIGFSNAKGAYCIFLDSDDFFSDSLLNKLYTACIHKDLDICICGFSLYYHNPPQIESCNLPFTYEDIKDKDDMLLNIPASGSNRLCRVDYLKKHNIFFQSLPSDNDLLYSLMTVLCTKKIGIINDSNLIFYRYNTDYQISARMNPLNMLDAIKKTYEEANEKSVYANKNNMIVEYAINTGLMEMERCNNELVCSKFYELFRNFLEIVPHNINNSKMKIYEEKWLLYGYESLWFKRIGDYYSQLKNSDQLIKVLKSNDLDLFMWGRGKRGLAFEKVCAEKRVNIDGVCDEKNNDIGKKDEQGNIIVSTSFVRKRRCLLVATNHSIYNSIFKQIDDEIRIVDLEMYCPL